MFLKELTLSDRSIGIYIVLSVSNLCSFTDYFKTSICCLETIDHLLNWFNPIESQNRKRAEDIGVCKFLWKDMRTRQTGRSNLQCSGSMRRINRYNASIMRTTGDILAWIDIVEREGYQRISASSFCIVIQTTTYLPKCIMILKRWPSIWLFNEH